MTTKHRFRGKYRLELRERDHGPPHVHLVGGSVDVLIDLTSLRTDGTWPRGLRAEVLDSVTEHRAELLEDWLRWHP